ncbi:antiviral reverse transcriptase Drt3a [Sunxiuqinia elliptica]|uniref:Reverse transcriptase (RNA-dependent DNA polymerase) n=1 Tax=Sunxiuqinia elliptica TaxID=655355 RepID=A0A4R6GTX6_9BACT|nr:antiviral reverse transcriptase Drt3a [Sunxiuqinia elliptica]TDN98881.1 reverse transcriptase (RNA-dependent DNA polymerase) [Sunxiuqinia elliptica]TDO56322.1 reverse transcriptase (RNA-dependent DNA polymerase) [Sunxiuqinia elliptica]
MLDQSFSANNFRKILDIENRKGVYLEGDFFEELVELTNDIKSINSEIKALRKKGLTPEEYFVEKEILNENKERIKLQKEEKLEQELESISKTVTSKDFRLELHEDTTITSKPIYKTTYTLENILTFKQLQYNFRKLYKVKQASRYSIVSHLKSLLDDGFPKIILKTDIKSFYESIPQNRLLDKIQNENLLTPLSRRFIQQILNQFNNFTSSTIGVPRGIGISAYLVELYMRDIDRKIKQIPNVMYYARYVDDIIVIFKPPIDNLPFNYKSTIKSILLADGLTMNEEGTKTQLIDLKNVSSTINYEFDYLGYKFSSGYKSGKHIPLTIKLSDKKKRRYAVRLIRALNLYESQAISNEKLARKVLIRRIRFLLGNTRLVNNKKNVLTGVYYTNSLLTTISDFEHLDLFFNRLLLKSGYPVKLKTRLSCKNSFVAGYNASNISRFSSTELKQMMKNWTK